MKTVLLIDDDPRFCSLVTAALRPLKVNVISAESAREGSIELNLHKVDLIILDGRLPDIDGICWLQRMREHDKTTPVIFVSASFRDTGSFNKLYEELNVVAVLHKPVHVGALMTEVEHALSLTCEDADPGEPCDLEGFDELLQEYKIGLHKTLKELAGYVNDLLLHENLESNYCAAIRIAHTIRGTAGSFGLRNIAHLMLVVEEKLKQMEHKGMPVIATCKSILNCIKAAELDVNDDVPDESWSQITPGAPLPLKVLVIDDDKFFLKRIEHLCATRGMNVTSFCDTTEIFSAIEQVKPDVVLLDLNMPGRNGFAVCEQLRSNERWRDLPIVVISAESFPIVETASLQLGATRFLAKPINNAGLLKTIEEVSNERPVA